MKIFCLLEIAAATVHSSAVQEWVQVMAMKVDWVLLMMQVTTDVYFSGYFSSSSTTFPGNAANTNQQLHVIIYCMEDIILPPMLIHG
jgi:hypothetical protein